MFLLMDGRFILYLIMTFGWGVGCFGSKTFHVWYFLVRVWRLSGGRNILCQFIDGQTIFGMPRGGKLSLAITEPK